jgi:hypothetical protein
VWKAKEENKKKGTAKEYKLSNSSEKKTSAWTVKTTSAQRNMRFLQRAVDRTQHSWTFNASIPDKGTVAI